MRSPGDLTAAALIRESAMRLFADRGFEAVSVRDVAAAAGVSPSLVIHHYRSKDGLRQAVDRQATAAVASLTDDMARLGPDDLTSMSIAAMFAERLGQDSAVPAYLRRLLVEGDGSAGGPFRELFDAGLAMMHKLERAGMVRPSADEPARTAFLLVNDLAVMILRDQIREVIGSDPFSADGLLRWTRAVMDVYCNGVFVVPGTEGER